MKILTKWIFYILLSTLLTSCGFINSKKLFGSSFIEEIDSITSPAESPQAPPNPPSPTQPPPTLISGYPVDLAAPLFEDDFNRGMELLTANIKWMDSGMGSTFISNQELNSSDIGGALVATPNNPSVFPDLPATYLETSIKMDKSGPQEYWVLPYSDLNNSVIVGCFYRYNSGALQIFAGDYEDYGSQKLLPFVTLTNYPTHITNYVGCEVNQASGTATAYLNSVKIGTTVSLTVPAAADSIPLLYAIGDGIIVDNVKAFSSFLEARAPNDDADLRIYNTPHASYYSNELASFSLQGYCAANGATVQVKDAAPGTFQSAVATCTNNHFAIALDLTDGTRFPLGANQIRIEYVHAGTREYTYNFISVATPPPTLAIGPPLPSQGDNTTIFKWPVSFSFVDNILFDESYVTLSGASTGCTVSVQGSGNFREVHVTGCSAFSGNLAISISTGAASAGSVSSTAVGPSESVSVANPVIVNFAQVTDYVYKGTAANTQQIMITFDKAVPIDLTVQYNISQFYSTAVNPTDFNLPMIASVVVPAGQTTWPISYTYQGSASYIGSKIIQVGLSSVKGAGGELGFIGSNSNLRRLVYDEQDSWSMIVTGQGHACGIVSSTGVVKCWGNNSYGQLGSGLDMSSNYKYAATPVSGTDTYTKISAGAYHTCGITSAGTVKCWGLGTNGQLGNGSAMNYYTPTEISGSEIYTAISAGYQHTCGIVSGGIAKCWGYNGFGQLGHGGGYTPTAVSGGDLYAAIAAGGRHTCGITNLGIVQCWGADLYGALGDGTSGVGRSNPMPIADGNTYTAISVGSGEHDDNSCGITSAGVVKCWGRNSFGAIGDGTNLSSSVPIAVSGSDTYTMITTGFQHNCGITSLGQTKCWGNNYYGQLGDGTVQADKFIPTAIIGGETYRMVSAGGDFTCGVTVSGVGKCWGSAFGGKLGDNTQLVSQRTTPTPISGNEAYSMIAAGGSHTCGITGGGAVKCWGENLSRQLGDGTDSHKSVPVAINGADNYTTISTGSGHTCGITSLGVVKCWGYNSIGQLGNGTQNNRSVPSAINGGDTYKMISAGDGHTCGITSNDAVNCWGRNVHGELGDGTITNRFTPTPVSGVDTYSTISLGAAHTCGITSLGAVKCWGYNYYGQLGDGTTGGNQSVPTAINDSDSYKAISAGIQHTCGIVSGTGIVKCWGINYHGQLGNGTTGGTQSVPTAINDSDSYKAISAGENHTCGLTTTGVVKCWGRNYSGQLGVDPLGSGTSTPVALSRIDTYTMIATRSNHTCGITTTGVTKCWGSNSSYQLGLGEILRPSIYHRIVVP